EPGDREPQQDLRAPWNPRVSDQGVEQPNEIREQRCGPPGCDSPSYHQESDDRNGPHARRDHQSNQQRTHRLSLAGRSSPLISHSSPPFQTTATSASNGSEERDSETAQEDVTGDDFHGRRRAAHPTQLGVQLIERSRNIAIKGGPVLERDASLGAKPGTDPRDVRPNDRPRQLRRNVRQPLLAPKTGHDLPLPAHT